MIMNKKNTYSGVPPETCAAMAIEIYGMRGLQHGR